MLVWALIGVLSGFLVGFTGAGAALVATPLFIYLLDLSIKEATVSVLYVILAGAVTQLWAQRKNVHWNLAGLLILSSFIGSYLTSFIKPQITVVIIQSLFVIIGFYSIYRTWRPAQKTKKQKSNFLFWSAFVVCGIIIGFLITMTGLAGGVVLVPFFISFVGLPPRESIATGLLVMWFNAIGAMVVQWEQVQAIFDLYNILVLALGCVFSAHLLSYVLQKVDPLKLDQIRKAVFSVLIFVSLVLVVIK